MTDAEMGASEIVDIYFGRALLSTLFFIGESGLADIHLLILWGGQ